MPDFHDIASRVRRGEPLPPHWDFLLRAATPITRLGMVLRHVKAPAHVNAKVISFGNITAGGTGKTPAVIACVLAEIAAGKHVAVITRGYGSARVREPFLAGTNMTRAEIVRKLGDEPALIRHHAPDCVIIKAARRVAGARMAIEKLGCDVIILDDAYQHVQIARDENVCLIDATNPFGNGHLVPRGILREPLSALKRATRIEVTRCDQIADLEPLVTQIRAIVPSTPLRFTVHAPDGFWRVSDGETVALDSLRESPVTAVSAIGNPEAFHRTLEGLGLRLQEVRTFRDHASIPDEALRANGFVVTTEKDAMRMEKVPDNVVALKISLREYPDAPRAD
jgi:tetraacyldisaccharide 4'-kinase